MKFFNLFFFFAAVLSLGLFASATPITNEVGFVKRDIAAVKAVFTTLKSTTDVILPQITTLVKSGQATLANTTPLLNQLIAALNTASKSLASLKVPGLRKRQSDAELASLVSIIVNDIAAVVQLLIANLSTFPLLAGLLSRVDLALNQVLSGLGAVVKGILSLIAHLLANVTGLLGGLGLTLGLLGL